MTELAQKFVEIRENNEIFGLERSFAIEICIDFHENGRRVRSELVHTARVRPAVASALRLRPLVTPMILSEFDNRTFPENFEEI